MAEIDLENRDPNDLNNYVKVNFEDVLGEPDSAHSIDCVWSNAYKCFNGGKKCCYLFLTILCGLPMALCWGCEFACLTFCYVWEITPCMKSLDIWLACAERIFKTMLDCFLKPCCETISICFSKIGKGGDS